jgi:putative ATPase
MADSTGQPLAERMRPRELAEFVGQQHLLGAGRALRQAVDSARLHSMILWGPPGCGKTTLARLLALTIDAEFRALSAVLAGVRDVREAVAAARQQRDNHDRATVLFIDEVHRFNKAQQDAFLPFVEDGTVTLIGATTENPAFELNNALLSRVRVYVLKPLQAEHLRLIMARALADSERGLGGQLMVEEGAAAALASYAEGDARVALSVLEIAADLVEPEVAGAPATLDIETLRGLCDATPRRFDKGGDIFYDQISALQKSIRGSSPDAALYWLARMLDAGCDPAYVVRRLVRIASEDIGLADPRALTVTLDAWNAYQRLGHPEGDLMLAEAAAYLACAPKSNALYKAFDAVMEQVRAGGSLAVPEHLRNAPTPLARRLGHGRGYRYAHDEPGAFAAGERYLPEALGERRFYQPSDRGLEIRIGEKLKHLSELDRKARSQE